MINGNHDLRFFQPTPDEERFIFTEDRENNLNNAQPKEMTRVILRMLQEGIIEGGIIDDTRRDLNQTNLHQTFLRTLF